MPDTAQLEEFIAPLLTGLFALVFTLWFKDLAAKMAKGLAFKLDKSFNEGDHVILDGTPSVIIRIGITTTVFGSYRKPSNNDEIEHIWRYVPNERIPFLKLEKIISDNETIRCG